MLAAVLVLVHRGRTGDLHVHAVPRVEVAGAARRRGVSQGLGHGTPRLIGREFQALGAVQGHELDAILELYIEEDLSADEIAARGFDPETVRRVAAMVDGSEYKRRQAPPGVKITPKAFGRDRRMPVTNKAGREYRRESPRGSGGTGV